MFLVKMETKQIKSFDKLFNENTQSQSHHTQIEKNNLRPSHIMVVCTI